MKNGIVQITGTIVVPKDQLVAFRTGLEVHKRLSEQDRGCIIFTVTADEYDPCRYHVFEQFEDHLCFEAHKNRAMASDWWRITKALQRNYHVEVIETES